MVTGPANRRLLTKEILDFCGALPIYNTELVSNPSYENGTASKLVNFKASNKTLSVSLPDKTTVKET